MCTFSALKKKTFNKSMPRCDVCTEFFTQCLRKEVKCPYCEFSACVKCHERYLLENTGDAHCMSCRKVWNREILVSEFTNVFVNKTYKEHRERVLFDRERSLMPETQPYVEVELRCRKHTEEITKLNVKRAVIQGKINELQRMDLGYMGKETYVDARIEKARRVSEFSKQEAVLHVEVNFHTTAISLHRTSGAPTNERRVFVRACPANGCKGFLSTAWKCGVCESKVCSKCHEVKTGGDDEHMCDPASVASAELISRDSRPCPNCASMIFKIEGCDQMYCTQCQTAFSWRTGRVETGVIHNPHYYEYLRRTQGTVPRNPGDVPCGGLPAHSLFTGGALQTAYPQEQIRVMFGIHQNVAHIQHAGMFRFRQTPEIEARNLRVKYMMNDLTDLEFRRKLQQREKHDTKQREIQEVVTLYTTIATDILQRVAQNPRTNLFSEFTDLVEYTKDLLQKLGRRWKCVVPMFDTLGHRLII